MNITRAAIENNRFTVVALGVVLLFGIGAYKNMPRNEDPGFIIRTAQVLTFFPGASPERVEQLVTDKLEKAIMEIPQLDFVSSTSRSGVSEIYVNIQESETTMRPIWDDLRRKVERAARELPDGAVGPIVNDEFGDVYGTIIALTGDGFTYAELEDVAEQVRNELLKISDAAKVEIQGVQDERVFVEYSDARLADVGLSAHQLMNTLQSRNILLPGGVLDTGFERIALEPSGNFESVEDLRRTIINVPGSNELIYLGDIASVQRGYVDPPTHKVFARGIPVLAISISLREGGNLIRLGQEVRQTLDRLSERFPIGLEFDLIAFQPGVVDESVSNFVQNLIAAITIVMAVMLVSLGLRTGLVVSSLIPMAMVMSLLVMSLLGIGLDQMSLAALIISLGLLVDNAIVMSESIMVEMAGGMSGIDAAIKSAAELRVPLLTSSLTTSAAFLPIYLAESSTGEYTAPLFKVVTITLMCSWFLTLTMIPMLCAKFLRIGSRSQTPGFQAGPYVAYRRFLVGCLRRPTLTLVIVVIIFCVVVFVGGSFIPNIFFPAKEQASFTAEFELPIGAPIERTESFVKELNRFIEQDLAAGPDRPRGITNWATFMGQGPPRYTLTYSPKQSSPEYAMMLFNTTDYPIVAELITRVETYCLEHFPDVNPTVRGLLNGPPITDPIEVRVSGEEEDQVFAIVDRVKSRLTEFAGTKNISDDWGARTKKLEVRIDQPRARRSGLTSQDVAVSLQTMLSGLETTQYREDDETIPVTLRSSGAGHQEIGEIENMNIFSQITGSAVPLKQVADLEVVWETSKILRRDRLKTVTVSAALDPETNALDVFAGLQGWLDHESDTWPLGYRWEFGGEFEASVKAQRSVGAKMPIAGLCIVLLLVAQFNSMRRLIIVLLTIPLGLIGVMIGLLVARSYFGFMTFLGVVSLAGIVINNAIVLLDRIKIEIEQNGLDPARAVIEAAQRRIRPILLTTATTVAGMLPLWFGGGAMYEAMAIAIIFGLLFATLLTLIVVPVLYSVLFRVRFPAAP